MSDEFHPFARLKANAKRLPEQVAIFAQQRTVTYAELLSLVTGRAQAMLDAGLDPRATTVVTVPDEVEHLITSVALVCLGTPNLNIASHELPEARLRMLGQVSATQTVTSQSSVPDPCHIIHLPVPESLADHHATQTLLDTTTLTDRETTFYRSTSGTTGTPKTIGLSLKLFSTMVDRLAVDPVEKCVLRLSSVEYDSSRLFQIGALFAGTTAAILPNATLETMIPFCHQANVTRISGSTYRFVSMLSVSRPTAQILPEYTSILTGSMRVPGPLRKAICENLTRNLYINFATSEVGVVSVALPEEHEAWPEGVGFPEPEVEVELRDSNGALVPAGEIGELWVRKPGLPGWTSTGDLLSWPEGGPLIFHARKDDMMIMDGINIFPGPIEDTLLTHPAVTEAIVYAVPSRIHGQIPVASVVLSHPVARAELIQFARERLGVRSPRDIRIITEIPRTPLGKPRPAVLRLP